MPVLKVHENGVVLLVQAGGVTHVVFVLSLYSYLTVLTPLPAPSPLVEASVIVPRSAAPGSVIVTVGAVLSTRRL